MFAFQPAGCFHHEVFVYPFIRCSGDEVSVFDDTFSEDDTGANTSDEEDEEEDSSSASSKGDPEQPEGSTVRSFHCKVYRMHLSK